MEPLAGGSLPFSSLPYCTNEAKQKEQEAALREEFRQVAETMNSNNHLLLRLPSDMMEYIVSFMSHREVITLGQTCRLLFLFLHSRDSVWLQQLEYFHHDIRDLRRGALLYTDHVLPMWWKWPAMECKTHATVSSSAAPSPTWLNDGRQRNVAVASCYEHFMQERRLYAMDTHREWHFHELTDLEDKRTGIFTVALHNEKPSGSSGPSSSPQPQDRSVDASPAPRSVPSTPPQQPRPNPGSPSPSPLPRVGDPIINESNPQLHLSIFRIVHRDGRDQRLTEYNTSDERSQQCSRPVESTAGDAALVASQWEGRSEEEMLEYVLRLSAQEAEMEIGVASDPATPIIETSTDSSTRQCHKDPSVRASEFRLHGGVSLPLKDLLTVVDMMNNNTIDQLHRYQVQNCTAEEDPVLLSVLAETLRSAKHRRLRLGNHHRAVRNNGATTRNRLGRIPADTDRGPTGTGEITASEAAAHPPPMNRMLRQFKGHLLEITKYEAFQVASQILRHPTLIDDFVVFHNTATTPPPPTSIRQAVDDGAREKMPRSTSASQARPRPGSFHHNSTVLLEATAPDAVNAEELQEGRVPLVESGAGETQTGPCNLPICITTPTASSPSERPVSVLSVCRLKPLPLRTRFFIAPELCMDGRFGLIIVDAVRVLVAVEEEGVSMDNPLWESPLFDDAGRIYVAGQGYNPQTYSRDAYNYNPLDGGGARNRR